MFKLLTFYSIFTLCLYLILCKQDYTNYKLIELQLLTRSQYNYLINNYPLIVIHLFINASTFLIFHNQLEDIQEFAKINNISITILNDNFQRVIDRESDEYMFNNDKLHYPPQYYPRYNEIIQLLHKYNNELSYTSLLSIGKSYEGRDLMVIRIAESSVKPIIWIDAGIHGREWIAPVTVLHIIHYLTSKNSDRITRKLLNTFEWNILTLANPDGYEYSHTKDRMWRKTRSKHGDCFGVDPNRNFDFHWMEDGASDDPCFLTYAGPYPFSEPETIAMSSYLKNMSERLKLYLSFHSYGQMWATPWAYTDRYPSHYERLLNTMKNAVKKLREVRGTEYSIGTARDIIYQATGDSTDWVYGVLGTPYAYSIELPPKFGSKNGFILNKSQIHNVGKETWRAVRQLAYQISKQL